MTDIPKPTHNHAGIVQVEIDDRWYHLIPVDCDECKKYIKQHLTKE